MKTIVISKKIKEYRKEYGITQQHLADLLGVSCQAISKWERGECYPDIALLPLIAKVIGCPIDDFFA
jgi:transcriptional regulator with XRE-family HTH domain